MFGLFKSKKICVQCNERKTRRKNEAGDPFCLHCEIQLRLESEEVRHCPVDGTLMIKEPILEVDIIIDRCPKCYGVWLDHEELELIKEAAEADGGAQFATGLALGVAIG